VPRCAASLQLWRVYLVPLASREPLQMSFEGLWMLDGKTASLQPVQVHRLAPPDTPQHELRLRIRCAPPAGCLRVAPGCRPGPALF
jgi:hypothetical protein